MYPCVVIYHKFLTHYNHPPNIKHPPDWPDFAVLPILTPSVGGGIIHEGMPLAGMNAEHENTQRALKSIYAQRFVLKKNIHIKL